MTRIVKNDPEVKKRLVELWEKACSEGKLTELNKFVEETAEMLQESQELNFQALGSYDAEVNTVKTYINGRLTKFDQLVSR